MRRSPPSPSPQGEGITRKPVGLPLADLLYEQRIRMGLTQEAVAAQIRLKASQSGNWSGATPQLIHRYEIGTIPRSDSLSWIAIVLHIPTEKILSLARQQRAQLESNNLLTSLPLAQSRSTPNRSNSNLQLEDLDIELPIIRLNQQDLDQLTLVTEGLMRKSWSISSSSLLPAVTGHFWGFGNVLLGIPSALFLSAHSLAAEVALLAGYLSMKSESSKSVDFYWQASERMASLAGANALRAVLLVLKSWQAHDAGQIEQALKASEQAKSLLGKNPQPAVATFIYTSCAHDMATVGRSREAAEDIESAEGYLSQLPKNDLGFYMVENLGDEVEFAKGWHLFHLKRYSEAAHVFEQILARLDPSWKSQQANILAHLGSVYARQGNSDQAVQTFDRALDMARQADSLAHQQRIARMRRQWLDSAHA